MRCLITLAAAAAFCLAGTGCAPKPVHIRSETERTETIKRREIVEPGEGIETRQPEETTSTRTETKERTIDRGPVVE